ncbi:hypothetical protein E4U21_005215 [Claviceps maximensis]|nr:hypothetical protein E4U21_005215 [Claviceps maximensis]
MPALTAEKDSRCVVAEMLPLSQLSQPQSQPHGPVAPAVAEDAQSVSTAATAAMASTAFTASTSQHSSSQHSSSQHSSSQHCPPDINYDYHDVDGHRILRLRPTPQQWQDFPAVLAFATRLHAHRDGCFKVVIPHGLHGALPRKPARHVAANAYKVKLIRRTRSWQVSTVPSQGLFAPPCPEPEPDADDTASNNAVGAVDAVPVNSVDSVDTALKNLKHLFRKNQNRQLRNIRYRVDVPAWTNTQRRLAGVPEQSPIYPLKGDKLDHTKAVIPGIHTPYVYESGPYFGATFQIHAEDFRLASLNHLYKGRKIWIVIPATAVDVAETALGRGSGCSQFMRHRAEFFFPEQLQKLGIPYRIVDQRPGETIVILPDAYHEGFSCGYTIAEAKNYADAAWKTDSYQPCQPSCKLATAIPAAFLRPLVQGEQRLDLCAAYGDGDGDEGPDVHGDEYENVHRGGRDGDEDEGPDVHGDEYENVHRGGRGGDRDRISTPSLAADGDQNVSNPTPPTTIPQPKSLLNPSPTTTTTTTTTSSMTSSSIKSNACPTSVPKSSTKASQDKKPKTNHQNPPAITMTTQKLDPPTPSPPFSYVTAPLESLPRKRTEMVDPEMGVQTMLSTNSSSNIKRPKTMAKAGLV